MRVLVTGAAGMLGSQLLLSAPDEVAAVGTDLRAAPGVQATGVDLAEEEAVAALFTEHGPFQGVLHTAAYTAVDKAEEEREQAWRANATACETLARVCARSDAALVLVSTDFVFDGRSRRPYREEDAPNPLSVYGASKLEGERLAQRVHPSGTRVVRTQWLYGPRGRHFPGTILQLARERERLTVVDDQLGSPTSTLELAPALWDVLRRGEPGIYHAACEGACSWYDFAVAILECSGLERVSVDRCTSAEYPRPAVRPAYSVLDCARLTALRGSALAPWREALSIFLGNENE